MSEILQITKGQGTGNDFVLLADPDGVYDLTPEQVAYLCDRNFGVGGDGFIRAVRTRDMPEGDELLAEEPGAEWFMDYRNADGSLAEMCGNGIRVYAAFLEREGLAAIERGSTLPIGTRAGVRDVTKSQVGYQVDLGRWRLGGDETLVRAPGLHTPRPALSIDVGNPHRVVVLATEEKLDGLDLTSMPALDPVPRHGANVEFVVPGEPIVKDGVGRISMRVYERGVGETLSCGTGAAAAALATRHWAGQGAPDFWRVEVPGGSLGVRMFATEEGEHVALSGPAELVFDASVRMQS